MTTPVGPDFIALQVRDLVASRKFYVEIFGFDAAAQSPPGAVVLKTEPIPFPFIRRFLDQPRETLRAIVEQHTAITGDGSALDGR